MRILLSACLILVCFPEAVVKAEMKPDAVNLLRLETDWHRCVRRPYLDQPASLDNVAAQRAALAACMPDEDVYVSAFIAAQSVREETLRANQEPLPRGQKLERLGSPPTC